MRRAGIAALITAGIICGLLGLLSVYIRDAVLDSDEAAERAVDALSRPEVRDVISRTVVDQIVTAAPDTLAARPLLEQAVPVVLGTPAFTAVFETAIRDLHRTMFRGDTDTLTVRLTDMVLLAKAQVSALNPDWGARIPDNLTDTLIDIQSNPLVLNAVQVGNDLRVLAYVMPLAALLAFAAAVFLSTTRGRTLVWVGGSLIGIGILTLAIERVVGLVVVSGFQVDAVRDLARVFWDAFASGLAVWALVVAGAGAVLAASVWWRSEPIDLVARLKQLHRFVAPPPQTGRRLLWILAWAVVGLLLIVAWQESLRVIVTLFGVVFLVNALGELLRLIAPEQVSPPPGREAMAGFARSRWVLATLGLLAAAGLIVGGYFAIARSGGDGAAAPAAAAGPDCNGYALLCAKRFDEIVIPATHNSMSSAEDGFVLANHSRGIIPQLDAGYRGLLIDLYYGIDSDRTPVVITDIAPPTAEERAQMVEQLGEAAVRSAEELRERNLNAADGQRGIYLCHIRCEIGATPLADELARLRDWLTANPGEALVIIIEDYVAPGDVADAFDAAGLTRYLHTQAGGAPWPTLRQMIDSGRRLVVMAENDSRGVNWYHDAFAFTQETPYTFAEVGEFDCAPNRGGADNPLFMINHWITPASAGAADTANTADTLNRRIAQCREERGRSPNIVGVDFYARGDALSVVAALNGVQ